MKLSKNLSLEECLRSETAKRLGIKNEPHDDWVVENLRALAEHVFQPLRDGLGVPIYVSSGYRSPDLNAAIGGAKRSQHMEGRALDLDADVFDGTTNWCRYLPALDTEEELRSACTSCSRPPPR